MIYVLPFCFNVASCMSLIYHHLLSVFCLALSACYYPIILYWLFLNHRQRLGVAWQKNPLELICLDFLHDRRIRYLTSCALAPCSMRTPPVQAAQVVWSWVTWKTSVFAFSLGSTSSKPGWWSWSNSCRSQNKRYRQTDGMLSDLWCQFSLQICWLGVITACKIM